MKVERFSVQACCGNTSVAFKLDFSLSKDSLPYLVAAGFIEAKHFTASNMLYIENNSIILTGNFGTNIVHAKCKTKDCAEILNNIEQLLTNME